MERYDDVGQCIEQVRTHIDDACEKAGRYPGGVMLLPVTKFHPVEALEAVQRAGITAVGENRVAEAERKKQALPEMSFHMIGQIQTNKIASIARWADWVHSIDSVKKAEKLARAMDRTNALKERLAGDRTLHCLIQVSYDGDPFRGGVTKDGIGRIVDVLESSAYLQFDGLMCVPPLDTPAREVFHSVHELVNLWSQKVDRALEFSAGMSADIEPAIMEGSTIVRVGTAILGPRPVT